MVMVLIWSKNIENVILSIKLDNFIMICNFLFIEINLKVNGIFSNGMENILMMKRAVVAQLEFKKQDVSEEIILSFYANKVLKPIFSSSYDIAMNILFL